MIRAGLIALLALPSLAQAAEPQPLSDQMLCEWIAPCGETPCTDMLLNPVSSLERAETTWLWDPLAEWNGFPVAVAETLPQAEALGADPSFELGLILVPMGRAETGALILDGYGLQYFPERALSPRAMRHHCTPVAEVSS